MFSTKCCQNLHNNLRTIALAHIENILFETQLEIFILIPILYRAIIKEHILPEGTANKL